jgi:hypothetical protein
VEREVADRERYGFNELRDRKRLEAAGQLEELAVALKQVVIDLRGEPGESGQQAASDTAYARVYWLRWKLGHVVADLGIGLPPTWARRVVEREYEQLLDNDTERKDEQR